MSDAQPVDGLGASSFAQLMIENYAHVLSNLAPFLALCVAARTQQRYCRGVACRLCGATFLQPASPTWCGPVPGFGVHGPHFRWAWPAAAKGHWGSSVARAIGVWG